jgi:hypothetical protein
MSTETLPLNTNSRLVKDSIGLGVQPGGIVMLHASGKAVVWIVGRPDVVLHALREALGPGGTLLMYVVWAAGIYQMDAWPDQKQKAYLEECPPVRPSGHAQGGGLPGLRPRGRHEAGDIEVR